MTGTPALPQVGAQDIDEFRMAFAPVIRGRHGIGDVQMNMVLQDFGHQAVHGAANACDQLRHAAATLFLFKSAFDCFHVAADAAH